MKLDFTLSYLMVSLAILAFVLLYLFPQLWREQAEAKRKEQEAAKQNTMPESLADYLAANRCRGFAPVPHYSTCGTFLTYHFRPDEAYEKRVDDVLTVYLAFGTDEVVGFKVALRPEPVRAS